LKSYLHKTILFFVYILYTINVFAQNSTIDSLQKILQTQKDDTNKVNTLNALSEEFRHGKNDYKNAMQYAEAGLSLAKKINYTKGMGAAELERGRIHYSQKNYGEANKNFNSALNLYRETNNTKDIAETYLWIGYNYEDQELYTDALNNYQIALKLFQEYGKKQNIAEVCKGIGRCYYLMDLYDQSLTYFFKALKLYEDIGDKKNIAQSLQGIGACYDDQDNNSEALKNYQASLKIRQEIGDKTGIAQTLITIGQIYSALGNYAQSQQNDSIALTIYLGMGEHSPEWGIPFCLLMMGDNNEGLGEVADKEGNKPRAIIRFNAALKNYNASLKRTEAKVSKLEIAAVEKRIAFTEIKLRNFTAAENDYRKSFQLAQSFHIKNVLRDCYLGFAILDSIHGNYKQAFENYKKYILYRDSLLNDETAKKSLQAKMQYESDKKEAVAKAVQDKKDAEAKHIRNLQYFAIAALAMLALVILLIAFIQWRNNNHKKKANALLQQQKEKVESTLTELKSTQSQLIQSEKMASLGELTAGIAHEIQNPLNFVNNFSEVNQELAEELKSELAVGNQQLAIEIANDIKENSEKINHHGKRADAIVKGMLQHSRSSTGAKELTNINALADEYLRLAYHGLRAKEKEFNVEMKTDFDNSICKINIIPQDIGRVLLNLYNNAFYAVSERFKANGVGYEPTISINTKKSGNQISISVSDNGNGIPQKALDKIFQPFFTTKPTGEGTGLGLSLSYDIIKAHGGEIKVNTKENEGAEFIIQLPANII